MTEQMSRTTTQVALLCILTSVGCSESELPSKLTAAEFWKRYDLGIWDDSKQSSTTEPDPAKEEPPSDKQPSSEPETKSP